MSYQEAKVYFDGSHYIAIPHSTRPSRRRPKPPDKLITIIEEETKEDLEISKSLVSTEYDTQDSKEQVEKSIETQQEKSIEITQEKIKIERKITKKELFNELYQKNIDIPKRERKQKIIQEMISYFSNQEYCETFVNLNFERKQRNLIVRRVRMCRKANLAGFNYFCTFTYDDKLHYENTFKKKLRTCFRHMCERKKWKYMGVWERSPKTNRLHFHGLFNIPNGTLPGELTLVRDYDTKSHKMQDSIQSTYFNQRFGRSDFKQILDNDKDLANELAYLMKYIEKTGDKIVYSKNLPQYFISDILDNDVICPIGQEDKKILLFDDFICLNEGELIGKVSPEVIEQMRKCNS